MSQQGHQQQPGQQAENRQRTNQIEQQKGQRRQKDDVDYQKPEDAGTTDDIESRKRRAS